MNKNEYVFWSTFLKQRLREERNKNYQCNKEVTIGFNEVKILTLLSIEENKRRSYELFRKKS